MNSVCFYGTGAALQQYLGVGLPYMYFYCWLSSCHNQI